MNVSGPNQPAQLTLDIVGLLQSLGIPYAVVGAIGVSFYGIPRATTDGDAAVWLNGTGMSPQDVCVKLAAAGYRTKLSIGDIEDPIQAVIVIHDAHENKADLLIGVRGMDSDAAARTVPASLLDSSLRIMGAEDLVAMKVFAGGPQDLIDVRGILQVSGERLDMDLLRKLARRYGADAVRTLDSLLNETH
jgi:hypothetical protein